METNRLGELVKMAKGDDRSLRQYARDSGVDAAIISKLINGNYTPKKPDVFRLLTSPEAAPRGRVTYMQLAEAADSSKAYQNGIRAAMEITSEMALATALMRNKSNDSGSNLDEIHAVSKASSRLKKRKGVDKGEKIINELQRFVALAKGLIFSSLGINNITFQIDNQHSSIFENQFDTYLLIKDQEVKEYIFRYAFLPQEYQKIQYIIENTPKRLVEELIYLSPKRERKVTIVLNCEESFNYMLSFKGKLSYNGELSIILVDTKKAELIREEYISHYTGGNAPAEMYII